MKSPTTKDNNPVNDTNNANYKKTTTSDTWLSIKQRIGANPRPRATQRTEGGASQKITTGEKTPTKTGEHAIQKRHRNGVEHKSQLRLNQPLIRIEDTIPKKNTNTIPMVQHNDQRMCTRRSDSHALPRITSNNSKYVNIAESLMFKPVASKERSERWRQSASKAGGKVERV